MKATPTNGRAPLIPLVPRPTSEQDSRSKPKLRPLQPQTSAGETFTAPPRKKNNTQLESDLIAVRGLLNAEQKLRREVTAMLTKANEALERNLTDLRLLVIERTAKDLMASR